MRVVRAGPKAYLIPVCDLVDRLPRETNLSEVMRNILRTFRTFIDRVSSGGLSSGAAEGDARGRCPPSFPPGVGSPNEPELDPDRAFTYRPYERPLSLINAQNAVRQETMAFWSKAKENPEQIYTLYRGAGVTAVGNPPDEVFPQPNLSGLRATVAVDELFNWHKDHLDLLNLSEQVNDRSVFDMHLTALFRRGEELYRSQFKDLPSLEIGTANIDYLDACARISPKGHLITLNHGIATLPFWLAALHRLPRPWNDLDPSQSKELCGFAAVTDYVLCGEHSRGLDEFVAELSETSELQELANGYGGWHSNADGSGVLQRQDQTEAGQGKESVRRTIETFILCHELAHVACGHPEKLAAWGPRDRWSSGEKLLRHSDLQQAEIEADALAVEMTSWLVPRSVGPVLLTNRLFAPIIMVEALVSFYLLLACGEPPISSIREINQRTHPLAVTRLECALYHFAKWYWPANEIQQQNLIDAIVNWRRDLVVLPGLVRLARSLSAGSAIQ